MLTSFMPIRVRRKEKSIAVWSSLVCQNLLGVLGSSEVVEICEETSHVELQANPGHENCLRTEGKAIPRRSGRLIGRRRLVYVVRTGRWQRSAPIAHRVRNTR